MLRFVVAVARRGVGRVLALVLGVVVATSGVVVLTTSVESSRAATIGTVQANARSAYDVLVRPAGSATGIERSEGLVQDNYLSGIFGGLGVEDYEAVAGLPGVEVAAPVANLGYAHVAATVFVDLSAYAGSLPALVRVDPTYTAAGGLARYPDAPRYLYLTGEPFDAEGPQGITTVQERDGEQRWPCWAFNVDPTGLGKPPQRPFVFSSEGLVSLEGPFDPEARTQLECYSTASPTPVDQTPVGRPAGFTGVSVPVSYPVLVAAVDPAAEDALAGVGSAVTAGRYLQASDAPQVASVQGVREARVPVVLASEAFSDVGLELPVTVLDTEGQDALARLDDPGARTWVSGLDGERVDELRPDLSQAFEEIAGSGQVLFSIGLGGSTYDPSVGNLYTTGQVTYERDGEGDDGGDGEGRLRPVTVPAPPAQTWRSRIDLSGVDVSVPVDNLATQVRPVALDEQPISCAGPCTFSALDVVGRFDPEDITGFSELSRVPLETYRIPQVDAADPATEALLGGQPLGPDRNLGGYLRQPPAVLTTLSSIETLLAGRPDAAAQAAAPISSIRVRVAGVTGVDEVSRARVAAVVAGIRGVLGGAADVDVTLGSSPDPQTVALPAGVAGPQELVVREYWARKNVAVTIAEAVDAKSLALLVLVLAVCSLYLAHGALASVRARRTELATLLALGWSRTAVWGSVALELAGIGLVGGVLGGLVAWAGGTALGVDVTAARAGLAVPAAVVIAVAAGLLPAWRAARITPVQALRPPVVAPRGVRRRRTRTIAGMAVANLARAPGRTVLAASGLTLAVAALTVLLGVTAGFRGQVAGSLLGEVVIADVTATDYLAIAVSLVLGAATLVDVLLVNLRERSREYAALAATGWAGRHLGRLVVTEGVVVAAAGSVLGAAVGLGVCAVLVRTVLTGDTAAALVGAAAAAVVGTVVLTAAALTIPVRRVLRLPLSLVLAEE